MTKYAANAMLATRISFINEIANICEKVDADVKIVSEVAGLDKRIGGRFLNAGAGFGGSCFPKDVKALLRTANETDYEAKLLGAVEEVNNRQKQILFKKIK